MPKRLKRAIRRGIYAVEKRVDPLWWGILGVALVTIAVLLWRYAGFDWWKPTFSVLAGIAVIYLVSVWLFVDDSSPEALAATMERGGCLDNIADVSYGNAMHDEH